MLRTTESGLSPLMMCTLGSGPRWRAASAECPILGLGDHQLEQNSFKHLKVDQQILFDHDFLFRINT